MKTATTLILAIMAATGVVSGPLHKRAEVTTTTTETVYTTVTVDGPGETPAEQETTTSEEPVPTSEPATDNADDSGDSTIDNDNSPANPGGDSTANTGNTGGSETQNNPPATSEETTTTPPEDTTTEGDTTTTGGSSTGNALVDASLYHHNIHRKNHTGADDLTWNQEIANYAATTAATCHFDHDTATGGGGYGQNIAMWASSGDVEATGTDVFIGRTISEMWYNGEIGLFPDSEYGKATPKMTLFHEWGHYTQVIWKDTTSVGCAVQYCPPGSMIDGMGAYFSVCNYSPAGNVGGSFDTNVVRPIGKPTVHAD